MGRKFVFIAVMVASLFSLKSFAQNICTEPVKTESGVLRGMSEQATQTCVWHGIPYAAAPIGGLRWKAPQPVKPWEGVREATEW